MKKHDKTWWKDMLLSVFIGACVSFLTVFVEGVADLLNGYANNLVGGIASTIVATIRRGLV